jgi:hypothetical protein
MWLEWPSVGGESPPLVVETTPKVAAAYRRHAAGYSGELPWVASSWIANVESVTVWLNYDASVEQGPENGGAEKAKYTVRLYFAEPEEVQPGQRVFDIAIEGQPVLANFDIVKEAGAARRGIVREFKGITVQDKLTLNFNSKTPAPWTPLLCGVELVAE